MSWYGEGAKMEDKRVIQADSYRSAIPDGNTVKGLKVG